MMGRCIFITGTGTAVGKTVIAAGLLRWFRAQGLDAGALGEVDPDLWDEHPFEVETGQLHEVSSEFSPLGRGSGR
jgi:dethiobiotin synthetase